MSRIVRDTPRPFQPPVAQRDIKAEIIYCVGGVERPFVSKKFNHWPPGWHFSIKQAIA
jgi:hypothetical protein